MSAYTVVSLLVCNRVSSSHLHHHCFPWLDEGLSTPCPDQPGLCYLLSDGTLPVLILFLSLSDGTLPVLILFLSPWLVLSSVRWYSSSTHPVPLSLACTIFCQMVLFQYSSCSSLPGLHYLRWSSSRSFPFVRFPSSDMRCPSVILYSVTQVHICFLTCSITPILYL